MYTVITHVLKSDVTAQISSIEIPTQVAAFQSSPTAPNAPVKHQNMPQALPHQTLQQQSQRHCQHTNNLIDHQATTLPRIIWLIDARYVLSKPQSLDNYPVSSYDQTIIHNNF